MNQEVRTQLAPLKDDEIQSIIDAYPLVTVLIAGADGEIDSSELEWGSKLTHIRSYNENYGLNDLFKLVQEEFEQHIDEIMAKVPGNVKDRYEWIEPQLSHLNDIIAKLPNATAYAVYKSFKSFAQHIAKAEGGFFRIGSISSEEKKLIELPMLEEVALEETED